MWAETELWLEKTVHEPVWKSSPVWNYTWDIFIHLSRQKVQRTLCRVRNQGITQTCESELVYLFFTVITLQVKRDFQSFYNLLKVERFKTQNIFLKRKTTVLASGKWTSAQLVSDWDLRRLSNLLNKIFISWEQPLLFSFIDLCSSCAVRSPGHGLCYRAPDVLSDFRRS